MEHVGYIYFFFYSAHFTTRVFLEVGNDRKLVDFTYFAGRKANTDLQGCNLVFLLLPLPSLQEQDFLSLRIQLCSRKRGLHQSNPSRRMGLESETSYSRQGFGF